jgi:hypothetical protein
VVFLGRGLFYKKDRFPNNTLFNFKMELDETTTNKKRKHEDLDDESNDTELTKIKQLELHVKNLEQTLNRILQFNHSVYTYIGNLEENLWKTRFPPRIQHLLCNTPIESTDGKRGVCVRDTLHTGPCSPSRYPDDKHINYYDKTLEFKNKSWTNHDKTTFTNEKNKQMSGTENGSHN